MSAKRSRKNVADTSMNNNYKKSKNITNTEITEETPGNIKNKRKETLNASMNEKKPAGQKRKLSESESTIPTSKKTKKKGKVFVDSNSTEVLEDLVSSSSVKSRKNKKKIVSLVSEGLEDTSEIIEPQEKKTAKKKTKRIKDEISDLPEVCSIENRTPFTFNNGINNGDIMDEIKTIDVKAEPIENGNVLPINILEGNNSDKNKTELLTELVNEEEITAPKKKAVINWPEDDLRKLVDRMEACIPEFDSLAFGTRVDKLEWESIAFKDYSVDDCRKMWYFLQKQIRRYRLLKEVLADAREWINEPKIKKKKNLRHPDMPRKPLSAYILFYLQKKASFTKTHPGLDATEITKVLGQEFKNLSPEKKLKYENLAAKKKKEYEKQLEEFYQLHPEIPRIVKGNKINSGRKPKPPKVKKVVKEKSPKLPKDRVPKRPPPPFHYYYLSELEKQDNVDNKIAFKELCKERWKELPDDKKVVWINVAEAEYSKYEEAYAKYIVDHPDCMQNAHKPILNKEELQIKDRVAGKPVKPPGSAYNLFARVLLQSNEIKSIPIRDRLNFVSNQWKNCRDEEKQQYKDLSAKLNEKYKVEYASYLETLPEEERKLELQKKLPKRLQADSADTEKKEKSSKKKAEKKTPPKLVEPEQPPISAFKYFSTLYNGDEPALQAWKALSSEQKKIYEDELVKKKQAYIVDFEKFLNSLSKEELEAFSKSRNKIKKEPEEDEEEGTETSDESGTEESEVESNDEEDEDNV